MNVTDLRDLLAIIDALRRRAEEEKMDSAQRPVTMVPTYTRVDCAREMQKALKALGLYNDTIDGDWGTNSRAAYIKFLGV